MNETETRSLISPSHVCVSWVLRVGGEAVAIEAKA